jgi:hypothetical protein
MELWKVQAATADIEVISSAIIAHDERDVYSSVNIHQPDWLDTISGTMTPHDGGEPEIIINADGAKIVTATIVWPQYRVKYIWGGADYLETFAEWIGRLAAAGPIKGHKSDYESTIC